MILTRKVTLAVAGVVAAGVLGTAGVAAATAPENTPAPAATASENTPAPAPAAAGSTAAPVTGDAARKGRHALRARGMHGEWVVKGKDGSPVTLVSVRGSVTAVGPTSVTVRAEDGYTATFTATADTEVRGVDVDSLADVTVGARSAMVGVKDGTTVTARLIVIRK